MRLYGKTFGEIWRDIPLSLRIVVVVGSLFIAFSFLYLSIRAVVAVVTRPDSNKGALTIVGGPASGYLDPSLASDGRQTVLVYTGLAQAEKNGKTLSGAPGGAPVISLAVSANDCKTWRWQQDIFTSKDEPVMAPDGTSELAKAQARYETPSIVYDPGDKEAPWKIFAYRYAWMGRVDFAQRYSMIAMKTAAQAQGPWSAETWVLSAAPDYPPPPYQGLVHNHINPQNAELAGITSYSRPSVVSDRGVLLMSLTAFRNSAEIDRVVLLASLDHGRRWVYAGTLLRRDQLAEGFSGGTAFTRIAGASLLREGARIYLAAVLGTRDVQALGTTLIPLANPAKAALARAPDGKLAVTRFIPRQSQQPVPAGGGYAAFAQACPAGIITSEFSGLRGSYQLFRTAVTPSQE